MLKSIDHLPSSPSLLAAGTKRGGLNTSAMSYCANLNVGLHVQTWGALESYLPHGMVYEEWCLLASLHREGLAPEVLPQIAATVRQRLRLAIVLAPLVKAQILMLEPTEGRNSRHALCHQSPQLGLVGVSWLVWTALMLQNLAVIVVAPPRPEGEVSS